jgi:hypothetical protein
MVGAERFLVDGKRTLVKVRRLGIFALYEVHIGEIEA